MWLSKREHTMEITDFKSVISNVAADFHCFVTATSQMTVHSNSGQRYQFNLYFKRYGTSIIYPS